MVKKKGKHSQGWCFRIAEVVTSCTATWGQISISSVSGICTATEVNLTYLKLGVALEVWPSLEPARPHNGVLNPVVEGSSVSDVGLGIHPFAL